MEMYSNNNKKYEKQKEIACRQNKVIKFRSIKRKKITLIQMKKYSAHHMPMEENLSFAI